MFEDALSGAVGLGVGAGAVGGGGGALSPAVASTPQSRGMSSGENVWSERPRYPVTNKTSGRRLLRYLDLGPSLLSIVSSDGMTEKHKYAYRELKINLVDVKTLELDRGAAGTYMCVCMCVCTCVQYVVRTS